jgi:hypothetical protein
VFAIHDTVTVELGPPPLVGDTEIHDPFPEAVQLPPWQPLGEPVTVTGPDPAAEPGLANPGEIVNDEHVDVLVRKERIDPFPQFCSAEFFAQALK